MRDRCYNPTHPNFVRYGGRGVTVSDRWLHSFEDFLADMGERPEGMTLDRVNNDRGYFPGNCKWSTKAEQNANRRRPRPHHKHRIDVPVTSDNAEEA